MTKKHGFGFIGIGIATVLASVLSTATVATAAATPESVTYRQGMTIVGFDREVAAANGYEIRTTAAGVQYSVKKGTQKGLVQAEKATGIVRGDCGESFITITASGGKRVATGYTVYGPVAFSKWGVTVSAPRAVRSYNLDHGPTGASWTTYRTIGSFASGLVRGRVNDFSFAALVNGAICYSGNPQTTAII